MTQVSFNGLQQRHLRGGQFSGSSGYPGGSRRAGAPDGSVEMSGLHPVWIYSCWGLLFFGGGRSTCLGALRNSVWEWTSLSDTGHDFASVTLEWDLVSLLRRWDLCCLTFTFLAFGLKLQQPKERPGTCFGQLFFGESAD